MRKFINIVEAAQHRERNSVTSAPLGDPVSDEQPVSEEVFYDGEITPRYMKPIHIRVLKNPSKAELSAMFRKAELIPYSTGKELRGFLDEDLYLWDSSKAAHASIKDSLQLAGHYVYFYEGYFKVDDYQISHPDMKADIIEFITNHPMINRMFPNGVVDDHDDKRGFHFREK